jgi:DNA replication and repair protein RecF
MDMTISQLKPAYFFDLQQYARILFQRNILLKEINSGKSNTDTLEIWNHQLARVGSRIMVSRKIFLEKLGQKAGKRNLKLTENKEELKVVYTPSFDIEGINDQNKMEEKIEVLEKRFINQLSSHYRKDVARCITTVGPHRDDYELDINGMSTKLYGSQGQQRTSVLSIKLAEIDIMREERGENPVLLLDDVLTELDAGRRKYLFENIEDIQTFITCTDRENFKAIEKEAKFFNIIKGNAYY